MKRAGKNRRPSVSFRIFLMVIQLVYEIISAAGKILVILKPGMRFSKGKSIIWRSDFSKFSRSIFQEMLSLKVNSISTYSAGNAVSKGKLDICESADSVGKDSLGDAKIFFNFGCPYLNLNDRFYRSHSANYRCLDCV